MDLGALVRRLKERGAEIGLGAVGVATVGASEHADALDAWLAAGRSGAMSWMERTAGVRADPRTRFPWARSAVVASLPYLPYRGARQAQGGLAAHVARYALGEDYHAVLGGRLQVLRDLLVSETAARTRAYVDTGPILERELAARAGLGWVGKSTNLIAPGGDSWILLGQIVTDLDLPPDEPVADRCGRCTACIDACPTGAILEPYLLDARRCISYLTIELRGSIPPDQRPDLGDWLFGCDVCQEACPWNRRAEPSGDPSFHPAPRLQESSLADVVRLDEETFRERFSRTPLGRPGRAGLVRNALIVAANTRDPEALEAAPGRLRDPDPRVRSAAAWSLGRAGGRAARRTLATARPLEADAGVRGEIEAALAGPGGPGSRRPGDGAAS